MKNKYFNDAIIGNGKILASFSSKGELLRFFYPNIDFMQDIDEFKVGLISDTSNTFYLEDDINNEYNQYFTENTNILNTQIYNKYFKLNTLQTDFISMSKNLLVKQYKIENKSDFVQNIKFLIYSKILKSINHYTSGYFTDNTLVQYNHDYALAIFSDKENNVLSYQINNAEEAFKTGKLDAIDYIGMSNDSSIMYDLGKIKPNSSKTITIYMYMNDNIKQTMQEVQKIKSEYADEELEKVEKYWQNYVDSHKTMQIKDSKIDEIYTRTILTFPLLCNKITGGISAGAEVDENMNKCGRYAYCWPRDSAFISEALDICNMQEEATRFFNIFAYKTQLENGMWEQRYYTDGTLAPCWGYQIDETASVICGAWAHYERIEEIDFLKENLPMLQKACNSLEKYIENIDSYEISYDLWEMHRGIHLYSLGAICYAFECMAKIYIEIDNFDISISKNNKSRIENLDNLSTKLRQYMADNFWNGEYLLRNNVDNKLDISVLGLCEPFKILKETDKKMVKTVEKLEKKLKSPLGGLYRFEDDHYMENNPWVIATLWMSMYYIKTRDIAKAKDYFNWVCETSCKHGYLTEQVDRLTNKPLWVKRTSDGLMQCLL